jgi:DNA replication protein DnaC
MTATIRDLEAADARNAELRERARTSDRMGSGDVVVDLGARMAERGASIIAAARGQAAPLTETLEQRDARMAAERREARAKSEAKRIEDGWRALRFPIPERLVPMLFAGTLDEHLQRIAPDDSNARHALSTVESWLEPEQPQVLAVIGDMGRGKTLASAYAGLDRVRRRRTVQRLTEPALVTLAHSTTITQGEHFEVACNVDLLIVDELGTALAPPDRCRAALFRLLDARIPNNLRTLLVSNHGADTNARKFTDREAIGEFGKAYGGRLLDRMRDIGVFCVTKGPSLRGRT